MPHNGEGRPGEYNRASYFGGIMEQVKMFKRMPVIATADAYRFYVLRKAHLANPDCCDGCGRECSTGYTLLYVDMHTGQNNIAGWCCRLDCAINTVDDHEC
jgi:hypothetical protein